MGIQKYSSKKCFLGELGTTNIDGSEVILLDNEQVWRPTPTDIENLAATNLGIVVTFTIKIDLGTPSK